MKLEQVGPHNAEELAPRIQALEALASYPLGADRFRIDHGRDYFAFFNRLGALRYYVIQEKEQILAVAALVQRDVPHPKGGRRQAWYMCDFKVHPEARDRHIPLYLMYSDVASLYLRGSRGFAVSMNPEQGENRMVRLLKKSPLIPFGGAPQLEIFFLSAEQIESNLSMLNDCLGPLSFLSLAGIKDIILSSTGQPMKLLHVQHGPLGTPGLQTPQPGYLHGLSTPADSALARALRTRGLLPASTASVIHHRMRGADWQFILTSDI